MEENDEYTQRLEYLLSGLDCNIHNLNVAINNIKINKMPNEIYLESIRNELKEIYEAYRNNHIICVSNTKNKIIINYNMPLTKKEEISQRKKMILEQKEKWESEEYRHLYYQFDKQFWDNYLNQTENTAHPDNIFYNVNISFDFNKRYTTEFIIEYKENILKNLEHDKFTKADIIELGRIYRYRLAEAEACHKIIIYRSKGLLSE